MAEEEPSFNSLKVSEGRFARKKKKKRNCEEELTWRGLGGQRQWGDNVMAGASIIIDHANESTTGHFLMKMKIP